MMTTPGNKIITPGNKTTPAGNMTTTPGNKITTPGNKTTPPGNMTTTPVNMMTTPGNMMTTKDNMTTTPGNMTTTPGNKIIAPGNKITTPGNKTTTAGNMTTTPDNKFTSPDNKTTPPGNMTTIPLMSLPSETTPCSLEISNLNPIECIKVQSGTLAECDHDDMQINELVALPPSDQPLPSVSPEILPTELFLQSIKCIDVQKWTMEDLQPFANSGGTIMVTDLPTKGSKHREVGPILEKFSKIKCDKCFILPDNNTAFVEMEANKMEPLMDVLANGLSMKSATVRCHLLEEKALGSPIAFYKQLLKWSEKVCDETTLEYRLVYISNFHTDQDYWIKVFHDGINETGGVRVYLPLLGKIFVEFVTGEDADRFGLWLSSFRPKAKVKNLVRVMRPGIVPDMEAITPVCTNISHKTLVKGLQPPFWLVVPTLPCLYPTLTPQFYIPEHRTVSGPQDIEWAESCLTGQSVVMATGLPLGGYTHKDLVREVWPYFLDKDIPHVFYNVVILPLQRRAFIYFDDSLKCKEFASDYLQKPFTLGGCELTLHFLLDDLKPYDKEHFLFKHLLEWSYVSPKESLCNNQLVMTSITYVSMRALKFLFNVMRNSSYVCCIVLANRVIFQYPEKILLCKVMEILVKENKKYVGDRSIVFPKPYRFQTKDLYKGEHMTHRRHKELFNRASETYKNKSWPAPQDPSASPQDPRTQAGPDPPVLSPEVYRFFATAIRQHRQSRGVQEVSQEKRTSSEGLSLSQLGGKRSQISPLPSSSSASSSLSWRSRADGSPPPKRQRTEQMETMEDEDVSEEIAHHLVIFSSHPEVCDSQTKPSIVTKEQEAPSDRQVSEEVPRTSSYCSTSREVESSSSVTACSSSLSEASVSSTSDLPKSSSSSSVPPPSPVVLVSSSSEENTGKCPESPAQGCEDDDTTQPPSPPRMAKNDEVELPTGIPTAGPKRGRPPKRTAQNAQLEKEQPTAPVQEEAVVNPLEPTHAEDKLNVKEDGARAPLRRSSRRTNPALAKTRATATPAKSTREEQPLYQVTLRGKRGRKVTGSDAKENAAKKKKTTEQTAPPQTNEGAGEKESQEEGEERNPVAEMERQVTLNQVVEDEEQEKNAKGSEGRAGGTTKGELQPLVMLDDDTVKVEREGLQQTLAEPRPPLPEDQLVAKLEPESVKARWEQEEEEPKRVCSLSTLVANCYTLPPFTPHNPLGMNHVALKAGFYCKLCSVFYEDETKARTLHCSSLGHYNNLKVYYQRLKEENLGANPEAPLLANAPRRL